MIYLLYTYGIQSFSIMVFLSPVGTAIPQASFGEGTGPILLDRLQCTGTESSLLSCSHRDIGIHICGHHEDAGVVCAPCKLEL